MPPHSAGENGLRLSKRIQLFIRYHAKSCDLVKNHASIIQKHHEVGTPSSMHDSGSILVASILFTLKSLYSAEISGDWVNIHHTIPAQIIYRLALQLDNKHELGACLNAATYIPPGAVMLTLLR